MYDYNMSFEGDSDIDDKFLEMAYEDNNGNLEFADFGDFGDFWDEQDDPEEFATERDYWDVYDEQDDLAHFERFLNVPEDEYGSHVL